MAQSSYSAFLSAREVPRSLVTPKKAWFSPADEDIQSSAGHEHCWACPSAEQSSSVNLFFLPQPSMSWCKRTERWSYFSGGCSCANCHIFMLILLSSHSPDEKPVKYGDLFFLSKVTLWEAIPQDFLRKSCPVSTRITDENYGKSSLANNWDKNGSFKISLAFRMLFFQFWPFLSFWV